MADKDNDILSEARTRLTLAIGAYSESRESELEDLKFASGSPDNKWQWPSDVLATRGSVQGQAINARPCITINKLPQHIKQVTNDQRQNRPSGKVIPVDDHADPEVAEIFDGLIRHIEYISDADVAYDTACEAQVTFGEGYFRILTDYCDDDTFDQEIKIGRIRNSFGVFLDPFAQDPTGADANWGFITQDLSHDDYERTWPDAKVVSSLTAEGVGDASLGAWLGDKTVRIAEYFWVDFIPKTLNMYGNGESFFADSPQAREFGSVGIKPIKTRKVQARKVRWIKTNGFEVLEEREWAGKWIPIIRVIGNEVEVDGQIHISGLIRNAKDAQRMYNYWCSQEAEMLALAPKAPFIGYAGQFEGFESQWKTANINNWPYLEVNPDVTDGAGAVLPLPQRSTPPMAQAGLIQAKMGASDDIKSTTGQYDSSIGAESNEKSGKAILARQRQTDTGTFHYVDNLARSVRHCTRQIVDLIPKIYDTQRIARIVGIDGEVDHVDIDPTQEMPVKEIKDQDTGKTIKKIYNPGIGKYDVCVTTGPSYMTKRQETSEMMVDLSNGNNDPTVSLVMKYFAIKNADFPEAQEFAEIMKKLLPPGLIDGDDESPEVAQAKQQMEQMGQQIEQMQGLLQNVGKSLEAQNAANEQMKLKIQAYDAETKRISATAAGMSMEQIQDIVLGTVHGMMTSGDLVAEMPDRGGDMFEAPPQEPAQQVPQGEEIQGYNNAGI